LVIFALSHSVGQWDEALEDACDILEAEAWKRARDKSDLLLIFLLKAHRPAKYRETTRHEIDARLAATAIMPGTVTICIPDNGRTNEQPTQKIEGTLAKGKT
jgi:hypothetical protein